MNPTSLFIKILASIANVLITGMIQWLISNIIEVGAYWRMSWVILFFAYNLAFMFLRIDAREPGMWLAESYWEQLPNTMQKLTYSILYTLSFASLLYWLFFPFDLLLLNLALLQLPTYLSTKNTLHGAITGLRTASKVVS